MGHVPYIHDYLSFLLQFAFCRQSLSVPILQMSVVQVDSGIAAAMDREATELARARDGRGARRGTTAARFLEPNLLGQTPSAAAAYTPAPEVIALLSFPPPTTRFTKVSMPLCTERSFQNTSRQLEAAKSKANNAIGI